MLNMLPRPLPATTTARSGKKDAGGGSGRRRRRCSQPAADAALGTVNIAFVSVGQQLNGGSLGGVAMPMRCAPRPRTPVPLPGTFVAYSARRPRARRRAWCGAPVAGRRPLIADTVADLVAGKIMYPIAVDETGGDHTVDTNGLVLTGANADGTATASTCADYTSEASQGSCGLTFGTTALWTADTTASCAVAQHLYCFDEPRHRGRPSADLADRRRSGSCRPARSAWAAASPPRTRALRRRGHHRGAGRNGRRAARDEPGDRGIARLGDLRAPRRCHARPARVRHGRADQRDGRRRVPQRAGLDGRLDPCGTAHDGRDDRDDVRRPASTSQEPSRTPLLAGLGYFDGGPPLAPHGDRSPLPRPAVAPLEVRAGVDPGREARRARRR